MKETTADNVPNNKEVITREIYMKLWIVSLICVFFMVGEVVGGVISGSIALMTDAAHMLSDLVGFGISMFATWIGKRSASERFSYGFHRAEVIGGCASMVLIWGLTIWLIVEAGRRVVAPEAVEGEVMLITAAAGLVANIIMGKVLHHHGHDHDHKGHDHKGHDHKEHDHKEHDHNGHDHNGHDHKGHDHKGHDHNGHDRNGHDHNGHDHPENPHQELEKKNVQEVEQEQEKQESNTIFETRKTNSNNPITNELQINLPPNTVFSIELVPNISQNNTLEKPNTCHRHNTSIHRNHQFKLMRLFTCSKFCKTSSSQSTENYCCCPQNEKDQDINENPINKAIIPQNSEQINVHSHENYNIKAAIIHVLGDFIQSVAVLIASIVIYFKPEMSILDPILTFFSILVISTTLPMMKEFMGILMEGTPKGIKTKELRTEIEKIEGVIEIHDFHVWGLTAGKFVMSAHIVAIDPNKTLKAATLLCRKHKLFHSTIQVEEFKMVKEEDWIRCTHNLH